MTKLLTTSDPEITDGTVSNVLESGVPLEEAIPSLVEALIKLSLLTSNPEQVLDEAVDLLVDR